MGIYERMILTAIILAGSSALVFARRYKNYDSDVGSGISAWAIFLIIVIWWGVI